jgi:murein L,D-transpeptidase YafK
MSNVCHIILILFLWGYSATASAIPKSSRSKTAVTQATKQLKPELQKKGLRLGSPIFMRIFKSSRKLEVWVKKDNAFKLFKTYPIITFSGYLGPKLKEGDRQAPEGFYYVTASRLNPNSHYHLSFNLGYPNAYDRARKRTGSALMVHGSNVSIGCYAMGNKAIEEIYTLAQKAFENKQKYFRIHIFPFHMTRQNILKHRSSKWYSFWLNLKLGYNWFEKHKIPPDVYVVNKRYAFRKSN